MLRMQKQSMDMMQLHQAALTEALEQLLISPREIERAVQQHSCGGDAAYELMRVGQEVGFIPSRQVTGFDYLTPR